MPETVTSIFFINGEFKSEISIRRNAVGVFRITSIIGKKPSRSIPLKNPFNEEAGKIKKIFSTMLGKISRQLTVMRGCIIARTQAVLIKSNLLPVICVKATPETLEKNVNIESGKLKPEASKQTRDKIIEETIAILFDFSI